ncbi:MAG TPA: hypothetical protein VMS53_10500, partial [Burkholderiales bacterium]|nr:hypothetical protein [Burkholderiales bacterium]
RLYVDHLDDAGFKISTATPDASERPIRVESANPNIYYSLGYAGSALDVVRVNSTSSNQALDFDVSGSGVASTLDKVKFAPTLGTIDADTFVGYLYNGTTKNLETVQQKLDASLAAP